MRLQALLPSHPTGFNTVVISFFNTISAKDKKVISRIFRKHRAIAFVLVNVDILL